MSTQIQIRRDTTANWESVNPILADGEIGFDTTANKFKVGNGVDEWMAIEYSGGANGSELIDDDAYIRLEDGAWVASPSMKFEGDLTVNGNITIDGGQIVDPEGNPSGGPSTHVGPDAPDPAVEGQLWFNSSNGVMYVYYDNDGNPEWVATGSSEGGSGASTHVGPDAPDSAVEGQMWLNSDDGYLYVYYDNAGNPTWMAVERES